MLRTGNASLRPRDMALPEKRRCGVAPRPVKTFRCKKLAGFFIKPASFVSLRGGRILCAVSLRIVFQTFHSGNCSVFPQNLSVLSLRGGRSFCARRGNLKRSDSPSRNELWLRGTKQNLERKREKVERRGKSIFCDRDSFCFVLPCFGAGCHASNFKIAASLRSSQ